MSDKGEFMSRMFEPYSGFLAHIVIMTLGNIYKSAQRSTAIPWYCRVEFFHSIKELTTLPETMDSRNGFSGPKHFKKK